MLDTYQILQNKINRIAVILYQYLLLRSSLLAISVMEVCVMANESTDMDEVILNVALYYDEIITEDEVKLALIQGVDEGWITKVKAVSILYLQFIVVIVGILGLVVVIGLITYLLMKRKSLPKGETPIKKAPVETRIKPSEVTKKQKARNRLILKILSFIPTFLFIEFVVLPYII